MSSGEDGGARRGSTLGAVTMSSMPKLSPSAGPRVEGAAATPPPLKDGPRAHFGDESPGTKSRRARSLGASLGSSETAAARFAARMGIPLSVDAGGTAHTGKAAEAAAAEAAAAAAALARINEMSGNGSLAGGRPRSGTSGSDVTGETGHGSKATRRAKSFAGFNQNTVMGANAFVDGNPNSPMSQAAVSRKNSINLSRTNTTNTTVSGVTVPSLPSQPQLARKDSTVSGSFTVGDTFTGFNAHVLTDLREEEESGGSYITPEPELLEQVDDEKTRGLFTMMASVRVHGLHLSAVPHRHLYTSCEPPQLHALGSVQTAPRITDRPSKSDNQPKPRVS